MEARVRKALAAVPLVLLAAARAGAAAQGTFVSVPTANVPPAVRTLVVLPPSYERDPARRFPVLYFLHDAKGDEGTLLARGTAEALLADMRAGRVPEALLVAPRGVGTWYVDSFDGKRRYARFLDEDLVPFVDARYRTVAARGGRGALGISMGGYGAIRWGIDRPDLLAVVGGLSPAIQQLDMRGVATLPFFVRPMITNVFGKDARRNALRRSDVYDMLLSRPGAAARAPLVLLRCGTEDRYRLHEMCAFLGKFLTALGVANEVVIEPGGHAWSYWTTSLPALARAVIGRLGA